MRILVFGAGAIGSLLGYRLSSAGRDVTLIGRRGYVRAVQERGLLVEERNSSGRDNREGPPVATLASMDSAEPRGVVHPGVAERIEDIPAQERLWNLVVLTVKAYDTTVAAQDLAPHLPAEVPVLIVQNGVGGEELAREVLGQTEIISGVLTMSVSGLSPRHFRLETLRGGLSLAPTRRGQQVQRWAELFGRAGMRMATFDDYRALKWSKLLLNIQANAIPAILDMGPGDVFGNADLFSLERRAFLEAWYVMRGLNLRPVRFPGYPVPLLVWAMRALPAPLLRAVLGRMIASGRGDKPPSLQMDLASGRERSEVPYLNGAVVAHGQRLGLSVPVNRVLLRTLMGIVNGAIPWDAFRGKPQRLLAAVESEKG
jgi:2-dehydropantoate 2-reductase